MRIMVINPNTSASMTSNLREFVNVIKRPDTDITVTSLDKGPVTLQSSYDKAEAVPAVLELVKKANREAYDAIIIAAFCDPGLEAAREASDALVLGLEEVTLHLSAMLGSRFSIVTMTEEHVPHKYREVCGYNLEKSLASIRPLGLTVAQTDSEPELTKRRIMDVAKTIVQDDKAEVIVLGCAGMAGYSTEIKKQLPGVTVVDPTSITLKICEAMVDANLTHAKIALYAYPPSLRA